MNSEYTLLNQIVQKALPYKEIFFWFNKIATLYLENTQETKLTKDTILFTKEECFTLIYDFFATISIKYANAFYLFHREILQEKNKNCVDNLGNIWVDLEKKNPFQTLAILSHESMHKLQRGNHSFWYRAFFEEYPSIQLEFYLVNYLFTYPEFLQKEQEVLNIIRQRFHWTRNSALTINYFYTLLTLYEIHGHITEEILKVYYHKQTMKELQNYFKYKQENIISNIIKKNHLYFLYSSRYIIGTLLACWIWVLDESPSTLKTILRFLEKEEMIPKDLNILRDMRIPFFKPEVFLENNEILDKITFSLQRTQKKLN